MISLNSFTIFTKNVNDIQRDRDHQISQFIDGIKVTEMNPQEIQAKQIAIYNSLSKLARIEIGDVTPVITTEEINYKDAGLLIGNGFTFSLKSTNTPITQVEYVINFIGDRDALMNTTKCQPAVFKGVLKNNEIRLHYYFQSAIAEVIGPKAKEAKDAFLETIKSNNEEVIEYFRSAEQSTLDQIRKSIEQKLASNKKKADDLNHF